MSGMWADLILIRSHPAQFSCMYEICNTNIYCACNVQWEMDIATNGMEAGIMEILSILEWVKCRWEMATRMKMWQETLARQGPIKHVTDRVIMF